MEQPNGEPEIVRLEDLKREYYRLNFLVDTGDEHIRREMEVSLKAGELVGVIYDALRSELAEIKAVAVDRTRDAKLRAFQTKLAGLKFLENCTTSLIRVMAA